MALDARAFGGGAISLGSRLLLRHICTFLGLAIPSCARTMVGPGVCIDPNPGLGVFRGGGGCLDGRGRDRRDRGRFEYAGCGNRCRGGWHN